MMIVYTVIILCILIFVHELGHFTAAKLSGVKVNEFALGMGPAFFKKQWGETKYALRVFPIGGYCAMEGEDGTSEDLKSFEKKPARIRAVILAAGSLMNVLLAILILSGIILYSGTSLTTVIKDVGAGSPAQMAGLLPGDRITAIDGVEIKQWEDIVKQISGAQSDRLAITVLRDGRELAIESGVTKADDGRTIIGVGPEVKRNPFTALAMGTKASCGMLKNMAGIIGELFTGGVPATELTGPVGIAYMVDDTAKAGVRPLLYLVSLISLNLAIVNMLPIPALDGGRLLFLVIRKATGKAISDGVEAKIHMIGMALLLALMVFVTWNDIERLIQGTFQ